MDNASLILTTLDKHLDHPIRLVLYGRAALYLGFNNAPPAIAESKDVDVIIPLGDVDNLSADERFWDAQEATNLELAPRGLYVTHLFKADQVFLTRDWEQSLVPITQPVTRYLRLFRPSTVDLILTKMMRGEDAQDMADIEFMARHDRISKTDLELAFSAAVIPPIAELGDAYRRATPIVTKIISEVDRSLP